MESLLRSMSQFFQHVVNVMLLFCSKFRYRCFHRQHKLEEALLYSGRFTDALQALNDWLYRAEPQLAEDVPAGGEKELVNNLIDQHKVIFHVYCCIIVKVHLT